MASKSTARSSSAASYIFQPGTLVEISNDHVDGYLGSWFTGKIVRRLRGNKFVVEYDTIMVDEKGTDHVQETVKLSQLRPIPPNDIVQDFQVGDEVDAYHNDGWWEGCITESLGNGIWAVFFKDWSQQLAYSEEDLRPHHKWVNGSWIPPFPQQNDDSEIKETERVELEPAETVSGDNSDFNFKPGTLVEVSSEEDGFKGAWFCATVVEAKAGWKFVVEYESFVDDNNDYKLLRDEVSMIQIRPRPPKTDEVDQFKYGDEVDAYYNDGWWVGVISKVLEDSQYIVYFLNSNEKMEFEHSQLRVHQEWDGNKWVMASKRSRSFE